MKIAFEVKQVNEIDPFISQKPSANHDLTLGELDSGGYIVPSQTVQQMLGDFVAQKMMEEQDRAMMSGARTGKTLTGSRVTLRQLFTGGRR